MIGHKEWLRSFAEVWEDDDKAAEAALDDLGKLNQRARGLLLPVLSEAVLMVRRADTRQVERATPVRAVWDGETSLERRRQRLEQTFPLPDGRRVSWLEATVADHLARIEYLRLHIAGVERTIAEHQDAIDLIQRLGGSCLGDVEGAA